MAAGTAANPGNLRPAVKKMGAFLVILGLGLVVCALLVHRHAQRTGPGESDQSQPMNNWQRAVTLDSKPDYSSSAKAKAEIPPRIMAEEKRQKPEERRN